MEYNYRERRAATDSHADDDYRAVNVKIMAVNSKRKNMDNIYILMYVYICTGMCDA